MRTEGGSIYFDGKHYDAWTERDVDMPFYKNQVKKYGDPILELGCGTGRITIPIADEGHDITGLDISKKQLEIGKKKAEENRSHIDWIEGDMRNFYLDKNFNLIFIPFNTIHHILTVEDMEKVLRNVRNHLKPDGRFIVEFFNPDLDILNRDPTEEHDVIEYKDPGGKGKVKVTERTDYEKAKQLMHLTWYYYLEEEKKEREWTVRIWFPKEVDAVMKYNGFKIEQKYGDFDKSAMTNNSAQQILVCKKG